MPFSASLTPLPHLGFHHPTSSFAQTSLFLLTPVRPPISPLETYLIYLCILCVHSPCSFLFIPLVLLCVHFLSSRATQQCRTVSPSRPTPASHSWLIDHKRCISRRCEHHHKLHNVPLNACLHLSSSLICLAISRQLLVNLACFTSRPLSSIN